MVFEALPRILQNALAAGIVGGFGYIIYRGIKGDPVKVDLSKFIGTGEEVEKPKMPKFK